MANVNKVVMNTTNGEEVLIDLTGDSVTPETLAEGVTAHDASGNVIVGTAKAGILKGKKIVYDGDSICSSWGTSRNGGSYPKIIADIVEGEYDNQGVGGGRIITQEGSSDTFHSIVDNIVNLPTDGDLYCFEGGVNDHWHGVPLGTFSESDYTGELDKTTYCGALETIFRYALTHFVGKPICYIITHKCPTSAFTSGYYGSSDTFADFRDKALGICEKYSIPVYDAWKDSGINSWNASQLANYFILSESTGTGDGTHPNEQGYRRYYVPQLIKLFEQIMPIGVSEPEQPEEPVEPSEPTSSNILETVGYIENMRLSQSSGNISDNTGTDITGQIPVSVGDIIYMQNITIPDTLDTTNVYRNQVGGYKADGSWVFAKVLVGDIIDFNIESIGGNITQFTIPSDLLGGDTNGFIRISAINIDATSIIKKNEPIIDEPAYTNLLDAAGWTKGIYLSSGVEKPDENAVTTGYLPVVDKGTIYLKNVTMPDEAGHGNRADFYREDKSFIGSLNLVTGGGQEEFTVYDANGNLVELYFHVNDTRYIRLSTWNIDETSIITYNEPIE